MIMKRYKIITYKGDLVRRNIPSLEEADALAQDLIRDFNVKASFHVKVDKFMTLWHVISLIIRALYAPVYFAGVILLMLARLVLAFAYVLMLKGRAAKNIIKHMFVWQL